MRELVCDNVDIEKALKKFLSGKNFKALDFKIKVKANMINVNDYNPLSFCLLFGTSEMVDDFLQFNDVEFEKLMNNRDSIEALMSTNLVLSGDFLEKAFVYLPTNSITDYIFYSNVTPEIFDRFLGKMDFYKTFEFFVEEDDVDGLDKLFATWEPKEMIKSIFIKGKESGDKNLWKICIDNYAVKCEERLKEEIQKYKKYRKYG